MQPLRQVVRCLLFLMLATRVLAAEFELGFNPMPEPAVLGKDVVYRLTLFNRSGVLLSNVTVNVGVDGPVIILAATNSLGSYTNTQPLATNTLKSASFYIPAMIDGTGVTLDYAGRPTDYGKVTHLVNVEAPNVATNSALYITTVIAGTVDLGIAFQGVPGGVLVNDLVTYHLAITNQGPDDATGVLVTNTLPAGLSFISLQPSGYTYSVSGNALRIELGGLTNGGSALLAVAVQPTNAGLYALSVHIEAPGFVDPTPTNSDAAASFTASQTIPAALRTILLSTQTYNSQNGLLEQRFRLENDGSNTVAAARVIVSGITNWLYNATGTNSDTPYVGYAAPLAPLQAVEFVLQYFSRTRQPGPEPVLTAVEVPRPVVPIPAGTLVDGVRVQSSTNGTALIEFPTTAGLRYAVIYSDTLGFTNATPVQPYVVAPANRVQWLDEGPPGTLSPPGSVPVRFYRVLQLPQL